MDFMTAVKHVFANYANFSGRARRSEYWWFYLFNMIVNVVAQTVDAAIGLPILTIIAFLALIVPGIAVGVRRMHDVGPLGLVVAYPSGPAGWLHPGHLLVRPARHRRPQRVWFGSI